MGLRPIARTVQLEDTTGGGFNCREDSYSSARTVTREVLDFTDPGQSYSAKDDPAAVYSIGDAGDSDVPALASQPADLAGDQGDEDELLMVLLLQFLLLLQEVLPLILSFNRRRVRPRLESSRPTHLEDEEGPDVLVAISGLCFTLSSFLVRESA
ncbi:hypothetical protein R1sor_002066 [Riccia sorocarpa]|uniref:Uncharacterized protein n=1 Tax=Riccia sorocarpa TaxID=122646 RepID=A0ABD3H0F5_9MARC